MRDKLLFKLKTGQESEEEHGGEVARAVAALVHSPAFRAAEAAGAAIGSFTLRPSPFVAEAVGAVMRQAREQGGIMRAAFASDLPGLGQAVESIAHMGRQMAESVAEITRPDGYFAQAVKQAEEARRHFAEYLASLPEEEREELRQLAEEAPLCEVDVNANDSGVM